MYAVPAYVSTELCSLFAKFCIIYLYLQNAYEAIISKALPRYTLKLVSTPTTPTTPDPIKFSFDISSVFLKWCFDFISPSFAILRPLS